MNCWNVAKDRWIKRWGAAITAAVFLTAIGGCKDTDPDPNPEESPYLTGEVDVLWIVDNSNSMSQDQAHLAAGLPTFLDDLAANAPDLDYRMGLTTTQALPCAEDEAAFEECKDSLGNTGRLRGLTNAGNDTDEAPTILSPTSPDLMAGMQALIDVGISGSTREVGLWTTALAACASLPLPYPTDFVDWDEDSPLECGGASWDLSDPLAEFCHCLPPEVVDYNTDSGGDRFLRDDADLAVIIVSDEGDYTPMMGIWDTGWDLSGCTIGDPWPISIQQSCASQPDLICADFCKLDRFLDFFDELDRRVVISVIGPDAELVEDDDGNFMVQVACNPQNVGIEMMAFYLWAAKLTGGVYAPATIYDEDGCNEPGIPQALDSISDLFR